MGVVAALAHPELVVVDFAGTTLHEDGAVLRAYRAALSAHDIPFTDDDLAARRGASKRAVFVELAARHGRCANPNEVAARALVRFETVLREEYASGRVEEIPGAGEVVALLRGHGVKVALTSGFDRGLVDLLVGRLGWGNLFDLVLAGEDVPLGRPAPFLIYRSMIDLQVPDISRVAVVGDTPNDLRAATVAHAGWAIGVLSGAHGVETLGRATHTHLIPSVANLPQLFGLG
jgi:phosphoglycolate phosphatase